MPTVEYIRLLTMRAKAEGFQEAAAQARGLGTAIDAVATTSEQSAKGHLSARSALESLERKLFSTVKAQHDLEKAQRTVNQAIADNPALVERGNRALEAAAANYERVAAAAERAAAAQKKSVEAMVQKQTIVPDRAADIAAVGQRLDDLRSKYVPLATVQRDYVARIKELHSLDAKTAMTERERAAAIQQTKNAFAQQVITIRQTAQEMEKATGSTSKYAGATGLARHEMINMSRQIQDVGVSLASGQSLWMVAIQQGTQIADIMATSGGTIKGFFGQIVQGAANILTPMRLVVGGIAAIGTTGALALNSFVNSQRKIEQSLLGVGKASGATAVDINRIGKESASTFGMSISEAEEFASTLAATGRIGVNEIARITALGDRIAKIFGIDATEAAKKLAQAFADPAKGAEELNQRLGSFSGATQENIRHLMMQNRVQEAQALLAKGVEQGVKGVGDTVATNTNLWTALGNAASNAWRAMGEGLGKAVGVGRSPSQALDDELKKIEAMIKTKQDQLDLRLRIRPSGSEAIEQIKRELEALGQKWTDINEQVEMYNRHIQQTAEDQKRITQSKKDQADVDTAFPLAAQLREAQVAATTLQEILQRIKDTGGEASSVLTNMKRSMEEVAFAARAAAENANALKDQMAQAQELVAVAERLRAIYPEISLEVAKQSEELRGQLSVAEAVTAQERIRAQEVATYNSLRNQGRSHEEATLLSTQQTAIAQAQINSEHQRSVIQLQGQLSVAQAVGAAARMEAQERATIINLQMQGLSFEQASQQAALQKAATQAQITSSHQETMQLMQAQLGVAQAVGGAAKIEATYHADIVRLKQQGLSASQAEEQAAMRRKMSYAEVNSAAQEQLAAMKDQEAVAGAVWGIDQIRAKAQATYNKAIREGVDERTAEALAQQEINNGIAAATAQVIRQTVALEEQTALIEARKNGTEATVAAEIAYNQALRSGAKEEAALAFSRATEANVRARKAASQTLTIGIAGITELMMQYERLVEKGLFSREGQTPYFGIPIYKKTAEGFEQMDVDAVLGRGGSIGEALRNLTYRGLPAEEERLGVVKRLLELQPETEQITSIERLLKDLRQEPATLAREELIKELTDKLEQLKQSTDALNDTIELDPIYTQGHGYIGIGYYTEGGRSPRIPISPDTPPGTAFPTTRAPTAPAELPPPHLAPPGIIGSSITPQQQMYDELGRRIFGAAEGGSFMVGGTAGRDANYIPMALTRGEMVEVTPANQNKAPVNNITNIFNFPPDRSYGQRRTQRQAREGYGRTTATR